MRRRLRERVRSEGMAGSEGVTRDAAEPLGWVNNAGPPASRGPDVIRAVFYVTVSPTRLELPLTCPGCTDPPGASERASRRTPSPSE